MIDIINRGIGNQESARRVVTLQIPTSSTQPPALVIWQVGTNAVYRSTSTIIPPR